MSNATVAMQRIKDAFHRIMSGKTPIDLIMLCDFGKTVPQKHSIRIQPDENEASHKIDLLHVKRMIAIERQKYIEDPYSDARTERSRDDLISWVPIGGHGWVLLFVSTSETDMELFDMAVSANHDELEADLIELGRAFTAVA
jgi:hypothetical protein